MILSENGWDGFISKWERKTNEYGVAFYQFSIKHLEKNGCKFLLTLPDGVPSMEHIKAYAYEPLFWKNFSMELNKKTTITIGAALSALEDLFPDQGLVEFDAVITGIKVKQGWTDKDGQIQTYELVFQKRVETGTIDQLIENFVAEKILKKPVTRAMNLVFETKENCDDTQEDLLEDETASS